MSTEWRIITILTVAIFVAVGVASLYDPASLPVFVIESLAYICMVLTLILIVRGSLIYLCAKVKESWQLGIARFIVLYMYIIVGFGSAYYIIRDDFKDPKQKDVGLEMLLQALSDLQKLVPSFPMDAKREYDKWSDLEAQRRGIVTQLVAPIRQERGRWIENIPSRDNRPLIKALGEIEQKQHSLDNALIDKYKDYSILVNKVEQAEREIRRYSYFSFIYFSAVTIATVGYGDITPKTILAKMLVTFEILLGVALVVIYFSFVVSELKGT